MTDLIIGKRYRYTVEGTLNDFGNLELGESYVLPRPLLGHRGTVELLPDPLPTALSSVVRSTDAYDYSLRTDGWYCVATNQRISTDLLQSNPFHVRFDAGAA